MRPTGPFCSTCRVFYKFTFEFVYPVCCLKIGCGLTLSLLTHGPLPPVSRPKPLTVQKITLTVVVVVAEFPGHVRAGSVPSPFVGADSLNLHHTPAL